MVSGRYISEDGVCHNGGAILAGGMLCRFRQLINGQLINGQVVNGQVVNGLECALPVGCCLAEGPTEDRRTETQEEQQLEPRVPAGSGAGRNPWMRTCAD